MAADSEEVHWPEGAAVAPAGREAPSAEGSASESSEAAETAPLPRLDDLLKAIPASTRETLDDLFRARFTGVRRLTEKAFKR